METAYYTNRKACESLSLLILAVVLVTSTGCARMYHAFHYNGIARTLHEEPRNYFHSGKTGRIIPKEKCYCPVELPCYGFEPTCWRRWPEECVRCPVADEVINGEILIHENDVIESSAKAVFPPADAPETSEAISPDLSVGDTPDSNGSAQIRKPAPIPTQLDPSVDDQYRFASNPSVQPSQFESSEKNTSITKEPAASAVASKGDSTIPPTPNDDLGEAESKSLTTEILPAEETTNPILSTKPNDLEPTETAEGWKDGSIDETIDALIGVEASDHTEDDVDQKALKIDDPNFTLASATEAQAELSVEEVEPETGFTETEFDSPVKESEKSVGDAQPIDPNAGSADKQLVEDAASPSASVDSPLPSALPNFAIPLPINLPSKESDADLASPQKPNSVGKVKAKRQPKKRLQKNTVRFRAETKSTDIVVPTEGSHDSGSTIQFK